MSPERGDDAVQLLGGEGDPFLKGSSEFGFAAGRATLVTRGGHRGNCFPIQSGRTWGRWHFLSRLPPSVYLPLPFALPVFPSRSYTMNLMCCCDVEDCRQIAFRIFFFYFNFFFLPFLVFLVSFFFFHSGSAIYFVSPGFRDSANLPKYGLSVLSSFFVSRFYFPSFAPYFTVFPSTPPHRTNMLRWQPS